MADKTSRQIINELVAGGMSKSAIGRAIGRDSSLVSQISKGAKPGTNLRGALEQIQKGEKPSEPARRVNKATGKPQAVRKSKKAAQGSPSKLLKDKFGRIKFAPESKRESVFADRMDKIARDGGKVSFRITYLDSNGDEQQTKLFDKGGIYAQRYFQEARALGVEGFAWILEKLEERGGNGNSSSNLLDVDMIVSVGITAIY